MFVGVYAHACACPYAPVYVLGVRKVGSGRRSIKKKKERDFYDGSKQRASSREKRMVGPGGIRRKLGLPFSLLFVCFTVLLKFLKWTPEHSWNCFSSWIAI